MRMCVVLILAWALRMPLAWAERRHETFTVEVECHNPTACALDMARRLEAEYGCQFEARTPTDSVCGALTIDHGHPHVVTVTVYDNDEAPNHEHRTRLVPSVRKPNRQSLEQTLLKVPNSWDRIVIQ